MRTTAPEIRDRVAATCYVLSTMLFLPWLWFTLSIGGRLLVWWVMAATIGVLLLTAGLLLNYGPAHDTRCGQCGYHLRGVA